MLPRWMKWLLLGFIGYLLILGARAPQPQHTEPSTATLPPITQQKYPTLAKTLDADHWKRGINPDAVAEEHCGFDPAPKPTQLGLTSTDVAVGAGEGAACGAAITVKLIVWGSNGGAVYTGVVPLTLGESMVARGLDTALVGMRVNGKRTVVLPPAALARAAKSTAPAALLGALPATKLAVVSVERVR